MRLTWAPYQPSAAEIACLAGMDLLEKLLAELQA